jgi:hypothetical protein
VNKPIYINKKAPRMGKKDFSMQVISKELYKKFISEFPEYKKQINWKEFQKRWEDICETIRYESIYNPLGVKLGCYLGEIKFQYLPYKYKAYDREGSNEAGQSINYVNLVTRGKVAKVKWERRTAVKYNKILQFYAFEPHREMHQFAKEHATNNPEKIRDSRAVIGGHSVWKNK